MTDEVTTGVPNSDLLTALVEDLPFTWSATWALDATTDNDETIHIQFLTDTGTSGTLTEATAAVSPVVDWLLSDHRAVRLQAQNSDGAWACALIVLRPDTPGAQAALPLRYAGVVPTALPADTAGKKRTIDAWLGGIWYDSGDSPSSTAGDGLHNCSPVDKTNASPGVAKATLPEAPNAWEIEENDANTDIVRTFSKSL